MMLVLSRACTLAAHAYYSMQLPPIHLLFALPYVLTCWSVPYLCTFQLYYGLGYVRPPLTFWAHGSLLHCHFVLILRRYKRLAATLAFPLSVSVLSSQYLFQRGPIWITDCVECLRDIYSSIKCVHGYMCDSSSILPSLTLLASKGYEQVVKWCWMIKIYVKSLSPGRSCANSLIVAVLTSIPIILAALTHLQ